MISRFRTVAAVAAVLSLFTVSRARSQDESKPDPSPRETAGTKKDVEKRLKAEEKPQSSTALDSIAKTLTTAHAFQQSAISPDGSKVAWVEILAGKDRARTGNTSIYVKNLKTSSPPMRLPLREGDGGRGLAEGSLKPCAPEPLPH